MSRTIAGVRGTLAAAALALITLTTVAAPGQAASGMAALRELEAAVNATRAAAATGIDVVQTRRFDRTTSLRELIPRMEMSVPGGTRLRVHATVNPDSAYYLSVRRQPSGALLGSAGHEVGAETAWSTVSMLDSADALDARNAGVSARTALTGLPLSLDLYEPYLPNDPGVVAIDLILPPYADAFDEGWQRVTSTVRADGTTVIRGSVPPGAAASDGDDRCSRPLVEVTVGTAGVITSSRWTETCPREGTRRYAATASYGLQPIQPPTSPSRSAVGVLG
jgi:hypothetical protein